jgi:group I intron endonuclease
MTIYSIYKITNSTNGKIYIGWTSRDPEIRFREHQKTRKPKYQSRSAISCALEKYGAQNFVFEVLYQTQDQSHSKNIEAHFIAENRSMASECGYNLDLGGTGHKRSPETIEKHRQAIKGKKQSAGHIAKRAAAVTGERNGCYGRIGENHPLYGKSTTDYQKQRTSETNAKSYIITHPDGTVELITNLRRFALDHNVDPGNLSRVACGRIKHAKGYKAELIKKKGSEEPSCDESI